jgi:hypothetical protein
MVSICIAVLLAQPLGASGFDWGVGITRHRAAPLIHAWQPREALSESVRSAWDSWLTIYASTETDAFASTPSDRILLDFAVRHAVWTGQGTYHSAESGEFRTLSWAQIDAITGKYFGQPVSKRTGEIVRSWAVAISASVTFGPHGTPFPESRSFARLQDLRMAEDGTFDVMWVEYDDSDFTVSDAMRRIRFGSMDQWVRHTMVREGDFLPETKRYCRGRFMAMSARRQAPLPPMKSLEVLSERSFRAASTWKYDLPPEPFTFRASRAVDVDGDGKPETIAVAEGDEALIVVVLSMGRVVWRTSLDDIDSLGIGAPLGAGPTRYFPVTAGTFGNRAGSVSTYLLTNHGDRLRFVTWPGRRNRLEMDFATARLVARPSEWRRGVRRMYLFEGEANSVSLSTFEIGGTDAALLGRSQVRSATNIDHAIRLTMGRDVVVINDGAN